MICTTFGQKHKLFYFNAQQCLNSNKGVIMAADNRIEEIDDLTEKLKAMFSNLSEEQLNLKPGGKWSIAQIIDHIIATNESYFPVIKKIRKGVYSLPFIGRINFISDFFGNFILKSVQPGRRRKMKTFPVWEPSDNNISKDILDRFSTHQDKLKSLILDSSDLVKKNTVISSPVNKYIVYKLDKAFDIIVTHEKRHFEQAVEMLDYLKHHNKDN